MRTNVLSLFFVAAGVLAMCGAALDWDWFMNARKVRAFVALLGRSGARVFYGLLGATLVTLGALMGAGVIAGPK